MSALNSGKKRDANNIRIASSIALVALSVVLCSSIFVQLYLLPYNPLNGIGQENKAYAQKEFEMRISVDQDPIKQGDTQKITVTVRDANTNNKISDAFVKLAIDTPSGKVATGSSHTDDNGQTTFNVRISSDADTGTFNVAARASENGYASKTVTTSFEVIGNDNNNNNNDNNNNDNGGHNNNDHSGHNHNGANNNNNNDQVQVISQSNVCGNGKLASDVKCQNIGNQIQSGGHNSGGGGKHGQSQSTAQANVCGNGKGASDVNCQNLANQIQGDGNAVNVIGVQSGGGGDGGSSHGGDGSDNGGNDGQTGQLGVQQSGTSGSGDGGGNGNNNNGGGHHGQSQSTAQANVCGNGKGASDVNCQNLANQIQGDGNAVNVIGVQSGGGGDGGSSHGGDGSDNGGNDGQTGQLGVQQSGTSGSGDGGGNGNNNNGGGHHGQSQSTAQANVCGNGKGASDVNCQNLANQIQGDGNAVNVIGRRGEGR